MTAKKTTLRFIICVFTVIAIIFVYIYFLGHLSPKILGLKKSSVFSVNTTAPFYYSTNAGLYFHKSGYMIFDEKRSIWKGKAGISSQVSPNSSYILFTNQKMNALYLLSSSGKMIKTFHSVYNKITWDDDQSYRRSISLDKKICRVDSVQWSSKSSSFVYICDHKSNSYVYMYSIKEKDEVLIKKYESIIGNVYYTKKNNVFVIQKELRSWEKIVFRINSSHRISVKDEPYLNDMFINYNIDDFEHRSTKEDKYAVSARNTKSRQGSLFLADGKKRKRLIRGKFGYNSLHMVYYSFVNYVRFLPGNQFLFASLIHGSENKSIIFDLVSDQFMEIHPSVLFHYSLTSRDHIHFTNNFRIVPKFNKAYSAF